MNISQLTDYTFLWAFLCSIWYVYHEGYHLRWIQSLVDKEVNEVEKQQLLHHVRGSVEHLLPYEWYRARHLHLQSLHADISSFSYRWSWLFDTESNNWNISVRDQLDMAHRRWVLIDELNTHTKRDDIVLSLRNIKCKRIMAPSWQSDHGKVIHCKHVEKWCAMKLITMLVTWHNLHVIGIAQWC